MIPRMISSMFVEFLPALTRLQKAPLLTSSVATVRITIITGENESITENEMDTTCTYAPTTRGSLYCWL